MNRAPTMVVAPVFMFLFVIAMIFSSIEARAAIITGSGYFAASGFDPGVPADPVTGTVTYSFDNSSPIPLTPTSGITSSLGNTGWWESYAPFNDSLGLWFGGVTGWTFLLTLANVSSVPQLSATWISRSFPIELPPPASAFHSASNSSFTSTVPEPSVLALFGIALAGVRLVRRRKRKVPDARADELHVFAQQSR